jgi:hypothetical protein
MDIACRQEAASRNDQSGFWRLDMISRHRTPFIDCSTAKPLRHSVVVAWRELDNCADDGGRDRPVP